jgi:drug/metabolite transporter (DMT)-like permease
MLWIPITVAAATFQVLRTSRQHELRAVLSSGAAGFVRYLYGAPFAWALALVWFGAVGHDVPDVPPRFWPLVTAAGTAQIIATVALLRSFRERDFAIGTVYSKTEVLAVAIAGAIGLGEPLAVPGWLGALLVTVGVAWLASGGSPLRLLRRAGDRAAMLGLAAGTFFAIASVLIRAASRSMGDDAPAFDRALVTLAVMLTIQTVLNTVGFALSDPAALPKALRAWRPAVVVGLFSLLGSMGWAWAMTLENAAKVRTLGQIELLIAFGIAYVRLGERHTRRDHLASAVVLAGVVVVTVAG